MLKAGIILLTLGLALTAGATEFEEQIIEENVNDTLTEEELEAIEMMNLEIARGEWLAMNSPFGAIDENAFIEFGFSRSNIDGRGEYRGANENGTEVSFGFAPFAGRISSADSPLSRMLKNITGTVGYASHRKAPDDYLYSYETPRSSSYCMDYDPYYGYYSNRCSYCTSGPGLCSIEDVYGAEVPVRYVDDIIRLGAELPIDLNQRLRVSVGSEVSFTEVLEGQQTDQMSRSWETGVDAVAKVQFRLTNNGWGGNWYVTLKHRQPVTGDAKSSYTGITATRTFDVVRRRR